MSDFAFYPTFNKKILCTCHFKVYLNLRSCNAKLDFAPCHFHLMRSPQRHFEINYFFRLALRYCSLSAFAGAMITTYKRWTDNSISVHYLDESELILETRPHPVLGLTAPFLAKRTIHLPADPLENEIVWRTRKEKEGG